MANELRPEQMLVSTGVADNDTVTTKGYVDDTHSTLNANQEILTITSDGQTAFTLGQTPSGTSAFGLFLNGQLRSNPADYTFSGTALTWNDPGGLILLTTDELIAWYDFSAAAPALSLFEASAGTKSDVTGDGATVYTIVFDNEIQDIGSNYDNTTGIFTAPFTGTYLFNTQVTYSDLVAHNFLDLYFQTTSELPRIWRGDPSNIVTATRVSLTGSLLTKLNAADTVRVNTLAGGSTLTVDIDGAFDVKFSGYLLIKQ
jgi:hypothetical protein